MTFLIICLFFSSGMVQSVGANLSPDQTFGSIRSLSVTREVASFPLSRTPTPPPHHKCVLLKIVPLYTKNSPIQHFAEHSIVGKYRALVVK